MGRRQKAQQAYPDVPVDVVDRLFEACPRKGAYGTWMVSQVDQGADEDQVVDVARSFDKVRAALPKTDRDLYRYDSAEDVLATISRAVKKKKQKRSKGYECLLDSPHLRFYRVQTFQGMRRLGRDARWCITRKRDWKAYAEGNAVFVAVLPSAKRRALASKFCIVTPLPSPGRFYSWKYLIKIMERVEGVDLEFEVYNCRSHEMVDGTEIVEVLSQVAQRDIGELIVSYVTHAPLSEALRDCMDDPVKCAKTLKEYGVNPLSALTHPKARSVETCSKIWDISDKEHRFHLREDASGLFQLVDRPAMNVAALQKFITQTRKYDMFSKAIELGLLSNRSLTKDTKAWILKVIHKRLRLPC